MIQSIMPKNSAYPYSVEISNEADGENHFHSETELIFLLRGTVTYLLENDRYKLRTNDFILANPYENHSIHSISDDGCYVRILIQESRLRHIFKETGMMVYSWQESLNNRDQILYREVADAVRSIVSSGTDQDAIFVAKAYQQILRILVALSEYCPRLNNTDKAGQKSQSQHQKACEIMDYINMHFTEDISLNTISQNLYLSSPYISKIFKENFKVGVLEYINRLRVQKAMVLLCSSNSYITDIAFECGFSTANTFGRIFQKETGVTPTDYRRQHGDEERKAPSLFSEATQDYLPLLDLGSEADFYSTATERDSNVSVTFDFTAKHPMKRPRPWNKVLYAGTAELLLHHSAQKAVKQAIEDFEVEYVRIVGPFADSLQSYREDSQGNPTYFWTLLDEVLLFILENKVKPFIVLGYMPMQLAAYNTSSPFNWNACTAPPKSNDRWKDYLTAFFKHLVQMFSYEEVCTWRFEFWNDPAMKGIFWHESKERFDDFFLSSYQAFRKVLPDGQFGSPSFMYYDEYSPAREFLDFCRTKAVKLDFLCLHMFELTDPRNPGAAEMNDLISHQTAHYHGAEFVVESFNAFRAVAQKAGYELPIYITEWNVSPYQEDYARDTAFMGAYIMETMDRLPAEAASISFWSLTDYTTDFLPNQAVFTGELGMRTIGNLPKSSYLAFKLLKRMQGNVLETGEGYCITRSKHGFHIALHNYCFFNEDFLSGSRRPLSRKDRYQVFESQPTKNFYLNLTLQPGRYRIERHILDREHGSIYDGWIRMGAPEFIDKVCYDYLNKIAYPDMNIQYKEVQGNLIFSEPVPQHGVLLLSLIRLGD